jgi:hypothetical protein
MNNQAIELRIGDTVIGVGVVQGVVLRSKGWVRLTIASNPDDVLTWITFDVPSAIVVETDRPLPPKASEPKWDQPKGPNPKPAYTPIPNPVTPAHGKASTSARSSATGVNTGARHISGPEQFNARDVVNKVDWG